MANKIFNSMQQNENPMMSQFNTFMQNPIQFLASRSINIPQNLQNDPHAAVQYLLNNGQMSQDQFNKLSQMARQMGINLN